MKTSLFKFNRLLVAAGVSAACLASPLAYAANPFDIFKPKSKGKEKHDDHHDNDGRDDRGRNDRDDHRGHDHDKDERYRVYSSHPRSTYILSFGTGYAGQGYYYGPPSSSYYYQTPGVVYYRNRDAVPRQYYPRDWQNGPGYNTGGSTDASVQRALARRGYYNGPIDGNIGPGTRASIARYQRDRGLRPTGVIDSALLRSLGM